MNEKKIKSAIIIANGEIRDYERIRKNVMSFHDDNAVIISADGGLENTLKLSLKPCIVIGDMDSIDREKYINKLSGVEFIPAPRDKDESDTHLAVEHALEMGIEDITITGATGGRLDHTLANIMILASPGLERVDIRIVTEDSEIFSMKESGMVKGEPGKMISIFSITPYTTFIRTSGLKYKLMDERLIQSPVRGLSNVFTADKALLEFSDGKLLIIKEL